MCKSIITRKIYTSHNYLLLTPVDWRPTLKSHEKQNNLLLNIELIIWQTSPQSALLHCFALHMQCNLGITNTAMNVFSGIIPIKTFIFGWWYNYKKWSKVKLSILLIPAFIWEENLGAGLKQKYRSFNILEKKLCFNVR